MPIRQENKARYPRNWGSIRNGILQRAENRCENCGIYNYAWGWRDDKGVFHQVKKGPLLDAGYAQPPFELHTEDRGILKIIRIVLTIAHLDHTPEHNEPENLRAWCQKCHLDYDRDHHIQSRAMNKKHKLEGEGQLCLI